MPTWDDVVAIGLRFPEVEVGTSFRRPALKVRGKGMCRLRSDPGSCKTVREENPEPPC